MAKNNKKDQFLSCLYFWSGHALFAGYTPDTVLHKHHAVEIFIGIEKPIELISEGNVYRHHSIILNSGIPHQVSGYDAQKIVIVFDTETIVAQKLIQKYLNQNQITNLDQQLHKIFDQIEMPTGTHSSCEQAEILYDIIIRSLLEYDDVTRIIDSRIDLAVQFIRELEIKKVSTKQIADAICLSESRLIHLFKEQVGVPIRRYLLWLRLTEAIRHFLEGKSLTDAAHHAGFADYAHLSRTFRNMFGNPISIIFKNSQFVHVFSCLF